MKIVVKVGTSTLTHSTGRLNIRRTEQYGIFQLFSRRKRFLFGHNRNRLRTGNGILFKQGFKIDIPAESVLPITILGLLNTGIGCYLYFSSIGKISVQTVAICGYLEPLSAVLFSVIFLREVLLPAQIVGASLIIGGAIFGEGIKTKTQRN